MDRVAHGVIGVVDVAGSVPRGDQPRAREDPDALRAQLLAFTRQNAIVVAAMLVVPEDLLTLAYGDGWSSAGSAVRIPCAVAALRAC